jgi:hypothetical protein
VRTCWVIAPFKTRCIVCPSLERIQMSDMKSYPAAYYIASFVM